MSNLNTKILLPLFVLLLTITNCVKFEDPELSEPSTANSNNSPCHAELSDNLSDVKYTSAGNIIDSFKFDNATCIGTIVNGNVSNGSFEIFLGSPITENITYNLTNYVFEDDDAKIKFDLSGPGFPEVISNSGMLYVHVENSGNIVLEWCDVSCWPAAGGTVLQSSGRMICD